MVVRASLGCLESDNLSLPSQGAPFPNSPFLALVTVASVRYIIGRKLEVMWYRKFLKR